MVWAQRFCCAHISFSEKTAKKSKKHLDKSIHGVITHIEHLIEDAGNEIERIVDEEKNIDSRG